MRIAIVSFFVIFIGFMSIFVGRRLRFEVFPRARAQAPSAAQASPDAAAKPAELPPPPSDMPIPTDATAASPSPSPAAAAAQSAQPSAQPSEAPKETQPSQSQSPPAVPESSSATNPPAAAQTESLPPPELPPLPDVNPAAAGRDPNLRPGSGDFVYDPTGRRDPFKPFYITDKPYNFNSQTVSGGQLPFLTGGDGNRDSLEGVDVSQFRLLGIIWEVNDPKAMVQSPSGAKFFVHKQTRIGRNNGYVAAIREGEIVVVEVSADGKTPTTRVLSLQK